ncbi:MAG: DUF1549 domain-containing protein [Planctomycetes bacterium]|nr:DUF1549 domain-containing protein [Planctomycetota bacterium]
MRSFCIALAACVLSVPALAEDAPAAAAAGTEDGKVSFYNQIRRIFQANCQGCHQPAKDSGSYVMTARDSLLKGGDSGTPAIVPGKPDESYLVELITPTDGRAEMPKEKDPLLDRDINLIRQWIAEGAVDDTPAGAKERYDQEHPPVYTRPPVITSLDFSPDGSLLAVAGFHEVLLVDPSTGNLTGRLVGLSERIQSLAFSPDGARLLVTGGLPARTGEIQVWNVADRKLLLSVPVTYDTIYGGSWSPDGKLIAFGSSDNSVRAINAETGEQVLFQGAHSDLVQDTVFSADGSHVVSVSRDMTAKLTEVETQRFVDNVTSITPGALKGGMLAVTRHPQRDEIVVGGADGVAKVYRIYRETKRVIGDDANLIRIMPALNGRIFSVAVSKDGKRIAAGSSLDGKGQLGVYSYEFDTALPNEIKQINEKTVMSRSAEEAKKLEEFHRLGVQEIAKTDLPQAAVYAVKFHPNGQLVAAAGGDGVIRLIDAATGAITREFSPAPIGSGTVAANNAGAQTPAPAAEHAPNFIRDVNPVLSRLGCNAGTCHGSAAGKNGFKLSLRGYDSIFDVRALTDDLASRRVNIASPDDSLMLLKATGAVPHVGSQLITREDPYYNIIRGWIAGGAKLDLKTPRVARVEVTPLNPVVEKIGGTQQIEVKAFYEDGLVRDVTREAFVDSGNTEVATVDREGVATAVRRGEAPLLARYEGAYGATTLTVMGDREGFTWQQPPSWGKIDDLVIAKWQRVKVLPSDLCTDAEFIRRVYLDLTGLPPTADEVRAFLADGRDTRIKRDELVYKLVGSEAYVEYWTNKWADLLQVNGKFLGREGAVAFRKWIKDEVAANTPYDQFARKILTASGSNRENPAASYYKVLRDPLDTMENTTHLFLGVRFNCNKCHDHPFERWTQDQYYETAAFFARVGLKEDPESKGRKIGGTAVEGAKPFYEIVYEKPEGEVIHDRTKDITPPEFPFEAEFQAPADAPRREKLAAWITSPDNQYFARSYVNRLWGYLFGPGIIEPIDDIRAGNPATNPELLEYLTQEFIDSGFNVRHVMTLIAKSRVYQLSVETNQWNEDDTLNYAHAAARRLPAEVLYDAIHRVVGSVSKIPGVPPGTRAAELPDAEIELTDNFLTNLGRPPRESACECERSDELQLGPVLALISGPTVSKAIDDPRNDLPKLVQQHQDDQALINELFLRILNRPATEAETAATLKETAQIDEDHQKLVAKRDKAEADWKPVREKREQERLAAIEAAKQALAAYAKELEPKLAEAKRMQAEKVAALEKELADYEATLPAKLAAWEVERTGATGWVVIDPKKMDSVSRAKLEKQPDGSIFVSGPEGKTVYNIVAETDLKGITGVRLEALADDRLPGRGAGRAQNGNFVLTEFELEAASKKKPKDAVKVGLGNAKADFSQQGYDVATAIDGKRGGTGNGWASVPETGKDHVAVFELKTPEEVPHDAGTVLTFKLDQQYSDGKHSLGKFRLSITTDPKPLSFGIPADLKEILVVEAAQRSDEQKAKLLDFYQQSDAEWKRRSGAVAEAKKPLPEDPQLVALRTAVETASKPLADDPYVVRLRQDVEISQQQLNTRRLTAAQDLAWALINTPAFLFNH